MKNLCIIPARGGSKRIPRKNVKNFLGKPIIVYSIEAALNSGLFDEVMVSTDDEEIAKVAIQYGAKVPFMRSAKTSNDFATLADVIDEVKEEYEKLDIVFNYICCVLSTAPLIKVDYLKTSYDVLIKEKVDTVFPIVRFSYPVQRGLRSDGGKVSYLYPEYAKSRSQDLEPVYYDAGMFYWMKFEKGLKGVDKRGVVIPESEAQDVDNEQDWKLAELKYKLINN